VYNHRMHTRLAHADMLRTEAFSDAVLAIVMTIMVLELHVPSGIDWSALQPLLPVFLSYALSFVYLGIYWNNHHHLLRVATGPTGGMMWANLHLLFWLSLIPFVTAWVGAHPAAGPPAICYGIVLFCAASAYTLLQHVIVRHEGNESKLRQALGTDTKGKISLIAYGFAIVLAFIDPRFSYALYALVALLWVIPDQRLEIA
jgi:uncharacterized membrane protein